MTRLFRFTSQVRVGALLTRWNIDFYRTLSEIVGIDSTSGFVSFCGYIPDFMRNSRDRQYIGLCQILWIYIVLCQILWRLTVHQTLSYFVDIYRTLWEILKVDNISGFVRFCGYISDFMRFCGVCQKIYDQQQAILLNIQKKVMVLIHEDSHCDQELTAMKAMQRISD